MGGGGKVVPHIIIRREIIRNRKLRKLLIMKLRNNRANLIASEMKSGFVNTLLCGKNTTQFSEKGHIQFAGFQPNYLVLLNNL